jgi:hypothetical protein
MHVFTRERVKLVESLRLLLHCRTPFEAKCETANRLCVAIHD